MSFIFVDKKEEVQHKLDIDNLEELIKVKKHLLSKTNFRDYKNNQLYFHVPYCFFHCSFCIYRGELLTSGKQLANFIPDLNMEIQSVKPLVKEVSFKSVFVGGGTVTVLDDSKLSSLLDCIKNNFNLDIRNGEFSVELAPHGLTESKLDIIEKAGVNRITLGIQSLDSALLKNMNRPALPKEKLRSLIASISKRKFKDFNVDLMVGIEGRDITNLQEDFDTLSNWGCQSIMVYIDLTSYRNENKLQEVDYYKSMVQQLAKSVSNKFTVNFGGGINEYNRFISRDACQIRHDRSYYSTNFKDESIFCLGVGRQAQSWNKDMMFYYQ